MLSHFELFFVQVQQLVNIAKCAALFFCLTENVDQRMQRREEIILEICFILFLDLFLAVQFTNVELNPHEITTLHLETFKPRPLCWYHDESQSIGPSAKGQHRTCHKWDRKVSDHQQTSDRNIIHEKKKQKRSQVATSGDWGYRKKQRKSGNFLVS